MNSQLLVTLTIQQLRDIVSEEIQKVFRENSAQTDEKLLTQKEASCILKVSVQTIISYARQGKLKENRIGRRVYYKYSEIMSATETLKKYQPLKAA